MTRARLPFLALLLLLVMLVSLSLGKYQVGLAEMTGFLLRRLVGLPSADPNRQAILENVLLQIRLPRILAAALIGLVRRRALGFRPSAVRRSIS